MALQVLTCGAAALSGQPGGTGVLRRARHDGPLARLARLARQHRAGQRAAHLLQLLLRGHLLGEQGRLDAVEEPLEPTDQLRLRDAQLGVRG